MKDIAEKMSWEEKLPVQLKALYRSYGYQYYRMSSFEPYDLYRENKNFLVNQSVLTFTDADGRLMALKPDITISIAKDTDNEAKSRKLFYSEHVFRRLPGATQFTEIKQMGLEYIGGGSGYPEAEVLGLAAASLAVISDEYSLELSHMGYITALLEQLTPTPVVREKLLPALARKSLVDIELALQGMTLTGVQKAAVNALTSLPKEPAEALRMLEQVCLNDGMAAAVKELTQVLAAAEKKGFADRLRIEPSLLYDEEYYNGLVFQGYIKGLPRMVLSGGRYDKLLRRFDKEQPALGFALYFNELTGLTAAAEEFDVDVLLLYNDDNSAKVSHLADTLVGQGKSVYAEKEQPAHLRARRICTVEELAKELAKELENELNVEGDQC